MSRWPFETLNRDELPGIEEEELELTDEVKKELEVLAKCMQPELSKKKKKRLWEKHLRGLDPENDVAIFDDRIKEGAMRTEEQQPLPIPVLNQISSERQEFDGWLCEATEEELMARPSIFALEYQDSRRCHALTCRLDRFLKQRFHKDSLSKNLQQDNLKPIMTSLAREGGQFFKYESPSWEVTFFVKDSTIQHYWIQKK